MRINRYPENPLVTPADVKPSVNGWEVISAFNAGVIEHDGEILMLMRVAERPISTKPNVVLVPIMCCKDCSPRMQILEFTSDMPGIDLSDPRVITFPGQIYLTSISHLRIAHSKDGRHFTVDEKPALEPDEEYEEFGLEDPRITRLGDTYYVVYKGVAETGITQCLASTKDFVHWEKHGIILPPENMDAMIFPEKIGGRYALLHRPQPKYIGTPNMWLAYSEDLMHWGKHKFLMGCAAGTWEGGRIGGGAVPFLTDRGWVEIYHAATPDDRYCLGAILMDAENPAKILAKSPAPMMEPEADYEVNGFKDNVLFTCGVVVEGDTIHLYYGAGDMVMAGADLSLTELLDSLQPV